MPFPFVLFAKPKANLHFPSLYMSLGHFSANALKNYIKIGDISGLFSNNINKKQKHVKNCLHLFFKCL